MSEYSVEKFYSEYALKKEDSIIAVIDSGTNARKVCDLLNEQDKLIRELRAEVEVHKHPLFSTRQAEEKIKRYESDLRMCREKALYWRNKAEDIFGDMRTNVELKRENEQLKQLLDLFASDICKVTELLDDNNIEYELYNDVENFIIKWGVRIE